MKITNQKTKLMVSSSKYELPISKGACGKRFTTNSALCLKCRKWAHRQGTKWKVKSVLAKDFVCKKCKMTTRNETFVEKLNDDVETVKGFCYL